MSVKPWSTLNDVFNANQKYYVSVKVVNVFGVTSNVNFNGLIYDISAPSIPTVNDNGNIYPHRMESFFHGLV